MRQIQFVLLFFILSVTCVAPVLTQQQTVVVNDATGATILDWSITTFPQNVNIVGNPSYLSVFLDLNHTWVNDLAMKITNPAGKSAIVFYRLGSGNCFGCDGNNMDITFMDDANISYSSLHYTCGNNPAYSGIAQPLQNLNQLLSGPVNGNWIIEIKDFWPGETGIINSISLIFGGVSPEYCIKDEHPQTECNDPIQLGTGTYKYQISDFEIPVINGVMKFIRHYNSLNNNISGPLGNGWSHSYNLRLNNVPGIACNVYFRDGHVGTYIYDPDIGGFLPLYSGMRDSLNQNMDGSFTLYTRDNLHYHFDNLGILDSISDLNGNSTIIHYNSTNIDSITGPGGRSLVLNYEGSKIASIKDQLGRYYHYEYDENGNLITVVNPSGGITLYSYDSANRLNAVVNPTGDTIVANIYDPVTGKVIKQTDAYGEISTFIYTAPDTTESSSFYLNPIALGNAKLEQNKKKSLRNDKSDVSAIVFETKVDYVELFYKNEYDKRLNYSNNPTKHSFQYIESKREKVNTFNMDYRSEAEIIDIGGDFESGSTFEENGWTVENGDEANQWYLGSVPDPLTTGARSAFISGDGGASNTYVNTNTSIVHFYREVTIPAGKTVANLTFDWWAKGESGSWDALMVSVAPSYYIPLASSASLGTGGLNDPAVTLAQLWNHNNVQTATITIPSSFMKNCDEPTTFLIIFTWKNDGSAGIPPSGAIDNIVLSASDGTYLDPGIYNVGVGGDYNTLSDAVAAYNGSCLTGPVVFELTDSNYPSEVFPIVIGSGPSASDSNTLTIRPATENIATLSGSSSSAILKLESADYIVIDGSNSGGIDQSLNISNTADSNNSSAIWVSSQGSGMGATNNVIKNLSITAGNSGNVPGVNTFGIFIGGTSIYNSGTGSDNDNIILQNNSIKKARYGIYARGSSVSSANDNLQIIDNKIGSDITDEFVTVRGIDISNAHAPIVRGNEIFNLKTTLDANNAAIECGSGVDDGIFSGNYIHGIYSESPGGYGAYGINFNSSSDVYNNTIVNNFITDIRTINYSTTSVTWNAFGIRLAGGTNTKVFYNSVNLFGDIIEGSTNTAGSSSALVIAGSSLSGLEVANNILRNVQTFASGATSIYSVWVPSNFEFLSIYNNLYHGTASGNTIYHIGRVGTANYSTLEAWQSYTGEDIYSIFEDPLFVSESDLHLSPSGSPAESGAVQINDISDDIDGDIRWGNDGYTGFGIAPDIGADEGEYSLFDIAGPIIEFNDLSNSVCVGSKVLMSEIVDFSGVDTVSQSKPRLWFKKSTEANAFPPTNTASSNGWKYVEAQSDSSSFNFELDYSLLTGNVGTGDTIEYFVVAQDVVIPPNVSTKGVIYANPPTSVALSPEVFPVSNVNSFMFYSELNAIVLDINICVSDDVMLLLAENSGPDATYQWESSSAGSGIWTPLQGAVTPTYLTEEISAATDFRCLIYCDGIEADISPSHEVSVFVGNPELLSTTPAIVYFPNGPVSLTLEATANPGNEIRWYDLQEEGTLLGTGNLFTTPPISYSTIFYVEASEVTPDCKTIREPVLAEIFSGLSDRLTIVTNPDSSQIFVWHDSNIRRINETDELGFSRLYEYDIHTNESGITNEIGQIVKRLYDKRGNMLSDTFPGNSISNIVYNRFNSPIQITNAEGNDIFFYYNEITNNLDSTMLADSTIAKFVFDNLGQVIKMIDGRGNVTMYSYSDQGDLFSIQTPAGTRYYTYDAVGRKITEADENGNTTSYTYDNNNNIIVITDPLGRTVESTYDANNQLLSITDKNGSITYYKYDKKGRKVSTTDPKGGVTSYSYDVRDNLISVTDPNNNVVSYTYDARNMKTSMTDVLGTTFFEYDPVGNLTKVIDPDNNTTVNTYTHTNKIESSFDALDNATTYNYDNNDNLISVTDPLNRTTHYSYDALNRLISVTDPEGKVTAISYDANGNRETVSDPNQHVISYNYDSSDRLISMHDPEGNLINYNYDPVGNITLIEKPTGTITYTYDQANRVISVLNSTGDNYSFSYDNNDNILSMANIAGYTEMEYDSLNRLSQYTDPYGKIVSFNYDAFGNITSIVYPDAKTVSYAYDGANNLVSVIDWFGNTFLYSYDYSGRLVELLYPNGIRCDYEYDQAGRFISLIYYSEDSIIIAGSYFTLDASGNRLTEQRFGQEPKLNEDCARVYEYASDDAMLSDSIWTYSHDTSGNRISETDGDATASYAFTVDNLMTNRTDTEGKTYSYSYNPLGHRLSRTEGTNARRYVLDISTSLSKVLQITDENGAIIADYIYGLGLLAQIDSQDNILYYHFDGQHNTIMLTDEDAEVQDRYTYDPFGTLLTHSGSTVQPFTFLGEFGVEAEAPGLYYVRARYYDALNGRFLSKDTYEYDLNNPQTINRFVYSINNPITVFDYTGLFGKKLTGYFKSFAASAEAILATTEALLPITPESWGSFMSQSNSLLGKWGGPGVSFLSASATAYDIIINKNKSPSNYFDLGFSTVMGVAGVIAKLTIVGASAVVGAKVVLIAGATYLVLNGVFYISTGESFSKFVFKDRSKSVDTDNNKHTYK